MAGASIEIPGVDFNAIAREAIAHQITKAMVGSETMIDQIVASALTTKVNKDGRVSNSSYENVTPFVEWVAQDLIRGAVTQALKAKIEELKPQIEAAVVRGIKTHAPKLARGLVEGLDKRIRDSWFKVEIAVKE